METNDLVFIAGQGGMDPVSGEIGDGVEDQTRQTMANLQTILTSLGLDFSNVVKTSIFLVDMDDWPRMNSVYESYFAGDPPARTTVGVASLPHPEMKVEIDMIATR